MFGGLDVNLFNFPSAKPEYSLLASVFFHGFFSGQEVADTFVSVSRTSNIVVMGER